MAERRSEHTRRTLMNAIEIDNQYETTENACVTTMRSQQLSSPTPPSEELRQTGRDMAVALVDAAPAPILPYAISTTSRSTARLLSRRAWSPPTQAWPSTCSSRCSCTRPSASAATLRWAQRCSQSPSQLWRLWERRRRHRQRRACRCPLHSRRRKRRRRQRPPALADEDQIVVVAAAAAASAAGRCRHGHTRAAAAGGRYGSRRRDDHAAIIFVGCD